jgi:adenylate cyclase
VIRAIGRLASGIGPRQVRIFCGLILFAYLLSHFANHALGNISFDAMEQGLDYHMLFWRDPWVVPVFYGAALTHWLLGLWALYARREFRYPAREITQLVLGLSIPALIAIHLVGVRLQVPLFDRHFSYAQSLWGYWVARPNVHWLQYTLLLVAWTHGCIGLYFWLRLNRWFRAAAPYLLAAAVLIPTLALLGLAQGAREVIALSADPKWRATYVSPQRLPTPAQGALLDAIIQYFWIGYAVLILLIFAARGVRDWLEHRGGTIALSYPDGRVVRVPKGLSVLEASLRHKVPHASVCGGRARCSTCRIRVLGDIAELPVPSHREAFVLERVGASADPAIRLACQLRPDSDVAFHLLFPADTSATSMHRAVLRSIGEERYLVCMFVDIRRSTGLVEKRLPFDTMFLINRFVAAVARAVEESGGQPNQFLGDGVLALFGLRVPPEVACRQALAAIGRIAQNVDALNRDLAADLREPIRFGIGVNGGDVVIGDIGYKDRIVFTALGDAVNVAARLQDLTKEHDCEALIAEDVCRRAGVGADALASLEVAIRGRSDRLQVCAAPQAANVAVLMAPT